MQMDESFRDRCATHIVDDVAPAWVRADTLALERALGELPALTRSVLWLYHVEGYSHPEIAELVGKTTSFSKSQVARGTARLRSDTRSATIPDPRWEPRMSDLNPTARVQLGEALRALPLASPGRDTWPALAARARDPRRARRRHLGAGAHCLAVACVPGSAGRCRDALPAASQARAKAHRLRLLRSTTHLQQRMVHKCGGRRQIWTSTTNHTKYKARTTANSVAAQAAFASRWNMAARYRCKSASPLRRPGSGRSDGDREHDRPG